MTACLHCGQPVSAGRGFYELIRQPGGAAAGQFYTLCSDPCLAAFLQGGEPEPVTVSGGHYYTGETARGVGRSGVTEAAPAAFVELAYRQGWRRLRLITNDAEAREVGAIEGRPRIWWAES